MDTANQSLEPIKEAIVSLLKTKNSVTVAIDGRCASGKTTLAEQLCAELPCNLFHMDDFFLRTAQRTDARLRTAGGNIDHERFLTEVLLPLKAARPFSYAPYDCRSQSLRPPVKVSPAPLSIVEGVYACHPSLLPYYDLRIMLDIDAKTQAARILARNGVKAAEVFQSRWIPLEEIYFETVATPAIFDLYFKATPLR